MSSTSKRGSWWRTGTKPRGKDAVQLLLHEKTILDHSNRIHRQNTSLNLLVSVLTLYASRVDYPRHLLTTLDLLSPFKKQRSKFYVPNSVRMKRLHGRWSIASSLPLVASGQQHLQAHDVQALALKPRSFRIYAALVEILVSKTIYLRVLCISVYSSQSCVSNPPITLG